MLNLDEAIHFLSSINIKYNEQKKQNDPLGFLNEIIHAFHLNVPFQSITLMSKPTHLRDKPTLEEIKEDVISKRGGLCYTLNSFMKYLLEALGYKAYHIACHIVRENDHILTVVEIQTVKYLVDVGVGYPTFEAIPLNFEKESELYHHSFLHYKFVRDYSTAGHDTIIRLHKKGTTSYENVTETDTLWRKVGSIDLIPREFAYFNEPMTMSFRFFESGRVIFHTSLRLVVFTKEDGAKIIKDQTFFVEDRMTHQLMVKEEMNDSSSVSEKVKEIYPLLYDAACTIQST